jgi:hypothetical protein
MSKQDCADCAACKGPALNNWFEQRAKVGNVLTKSDIQIIELMLNMIATEQPPSELTAGRPVSH